VDISTVSTVFPNYPTMNASDKIGLYGKGASDVTKARADVKKATEHAAQNFSKSKAYNCTVQPQPKT
jgi:hypothetical protein